MTDNSKAEPHPFFILKEENSNRALIFDDAGIKPPSDKYLHVIEKSYHDQCVKELEQKNNYLQQNYAQAKADVKVALNRAEPREFKVRLPVQGSLLLSETIITVPKSAFNELERELAECKSANDNCISLLLHEARMADVEKERDELQSKVDVLSYRLPSAIMKENMELRALCDSMVRALEFYAAMKFNQEIQQWMPGNPDKALNAIAVYRAQKIGETV